MVSYSWKLESLFVFTPLFVMEALSPAASSLHPFYRQKEYTMKRFVHTRLNSNGLDSYFLYTSVIFSFLFRVFISKLFCGYPEWHLVIALRYFSLRFLNCNNAVKPAFAQEVSEKKMQLLK